MKKIILAIFSLLFFSYNSFAATATATASGNWTATSGVWSGGAGTGGGPAVGDVIIINSGVTVMVNIDLSASVYTGTLTIIGSGSLVITSTGKLSRTTGALTFSGSGAGSFLIAGTYFTTATSIPTFTNTSAKLQIQNGGILSSTASGNGGSVFGTTTSTNVIWDEGSIFELNGGNTNWNANTFFPNNTSSTTTWPTLRLTSVGTFANGSTGTTVNGILHINGTTAATSISNANTVKATLKGGLIADYAFTTTINSSQWSITGNNAVIGGAGGYTSSGSGGLVIAAGASVTAISNTSLGLLNISGSFSVATGVTVTSTQTTTCSGTAWSIANSGSLTFANLTIAGTPATQPATSFSVSGIFTVSASQTFAPTSGTITMFGASSGITNSGSSLVFNNLTIASTPTAQSQYNSSYSVAGRLTVNNGVVFSPTSGTVTITGANITNNSTTAIGFANLIINGSGTALTGNATVSGTLTLTSGVLTTSNANPSLLTITGSISGGTTNASFINGTLTRTLTNGVSSVFPVGNGGVALPFTIVPNGTPTITVAATNADAGAAATYDAVYLSAISHTEYWSVTLNSGSLTGASASAARQSSLSGLNTLAQSAAQNGSYTNVGGTVSGNGINSAIIATSLGYFTFATLNLAPSVISFSSSSPSGGTSGYQGSMITLTGFNFTGATSVSFGGKAADSFVVVNNTTIKAYVGSGNSGKISVTNNNGSAQSSTAFTFLGNNPNFLLDGDFELSTTGISSNVSTGGGTVTSSLQGQWQSTFQSPSSSGTSYIVDTVAASGTKSIALTINSQTNRNDIKLIQVIQNTTIPPAANMVLTFYVKGAKTGDSLVVNFFKSTTSSGTNGVSGDVTQPAFLYTTTNPFWKMCKVYVDLSTWTIAERTNMRLSIRPNSGLNTSPTPSGPYPKIYWFDQFKFSAIDTLNELKDAAISVVMDRKQAAYNVGFSAEVDSLTAAIALMQATTFSLPVAPTNAIGFTPAPTVTDTTNPYIANLYKFAAATLGTSYGTYPKATLGNFVFDDGPTCRDMGDSLNYFHWLVTSPYSKYRYNAELFRRLLTIVYASSDDYKINGNSGATGTPGTTPSGMNDWFAAAKISNGWWNAVRSFEPYIPSYLEKRIYDAADTMGYVFYQLSATTNFSSNSLLTGNYTNRDISYGEILMNTGMFRNNSSWIAHARRIVDSIDLFDRYPDGAFSYLGYQNETANYHGNTNNSLAKIWVVSGYQRAWDCVSKTANYEILSIEPKEVPEFYTAATWKSQWNGSSGASGEPLLTISRSPYLKTKMDEIQKSRGSSAYSSELTVNAAFYDPTIPSSPLPNNYLVYDRNVQGPRGRYGTYSYSASLRVTSPAQYAVGVSTNFGNLGMPTVVGCMVADTVNDIQNSVLIRANTKVHVRKSNPASDVADWGFLMTNTAPKACVSRTASSVSTPGQLQYQMPGPVARLTSWSTNQHWITLPDRMIGFVETYPTSSTGTTSGYEITGRLRFTYGNNGVLIPQTMVVDTLGKQYTYGSLRAIIKAHNYNSVDTFTTGGINDATPLTCKEILFMCDSSNGATTLKSYSGSLKKFFVAEVRNVNATGNTTVTKIGNGKLSGLSVLLNGNTYTSLRNDSTGTMTLNLSSYMVSGNVHQVHYSRNDTTRIQPITITSSTFSLPATEQILLISSSNPSDLGKGWENYDETLKNTGIFPATTTTNWTGGFNTDFAHLANWDAGVPNDSTNAIIYNVAKQPIITSNQSAKAFRLITGANVTNNAILSIKDTLTNRGTIAGTGTVSLSGTSNQKLVGIGTINNLALNNPAGAIISSGSNMTSLTGTLTLNSGTLTTNGNLTLKSSSVATASIAPIASGAGISGNITIERFIPAKTARKYSFVSSPVSQLISSAWQQQIFITGAGTGGSVCGNVNSNGFDVSKVNTASFYFYKANKVNNSRWASIANTNGTNLSQGIGYRINIRGSRNNGGGCANQLNSNTPAAPDSVVLVATGSYNSNPQVNVYGTTNYGSGIAFTFLGNPYPCAISGNAFIAANTGKINSNIWMFAHNGNSSGSYGSWNKNTKVGTGYWPTDYSTANPTDLVIPSGAAFFVERSAASDTIVQFSESLKVSTPKASTTIFGTNNNLIWDKKCRILFANSDSSYLDDMVCLFTNDSSVLNNSYTDYDTYSFNTSNSQYIASLKGNQLLSVNARHFLAYDDSILLKVYSNQVGSYLLRFSDLQELKQVAKLFLKDNFLNQAIDITSNPEYSFTITSDSNSYGLGRFHLVIQSKSGVILPNKNIVLEGKIQGANAELTFNTSNQEINSKWILQKSFDGKDFKNISQGVFKQNSSLEILNDIIGQELAYYRLKLISNNGLTTYSNTIQLKKNTPTSEPQLVFYPNPVTGNKWQYKISYVKAGNYQLKVYNTIGEQLFSQKIQFSGISANSFIQLPNYLSNGIYQVKLLSDNHFICSSIVEVLN